MSNLISLLPEDVRVVALQRQREETSKGWDKETDKLSDAFDSKKTLEGYKIWARVFNGNYAPFRAFHANIKQQQSNGWISVEERLPSVSFNVLVYTGTGNDTDIYGHYSTLSKTWFNHVHNQITPTHWQPLPPPPAKS